MPSPNESALVRLPQLSERMLLAFFVIVALVSGVRGYLELRRVQAFAAQSVAGEARFLECTPRRGGMQVVYEYQVADETGTPQRYVADVRHNRCLEGATFPIRYLPSDPTQVLIEGDGLYGDFLSYGGVMVASLVLVAWVPLSRRWKRRREEQPLAQESAPLE